MSLRSLGNARTEPARPAELGPRQGASCNSQGGLLARLFVILWRLTLVTGLPEWSGLLLALSFHFFELRLQAGDLVAQLSTLKLQLMQPRLLWVQLGQNLLERSHTVDIPGSIQSTCERAA